MNKKIRDLQIQAFSECKTFEDSKIRTDEVFERFAELIVRECINGIYVADEGDLKGKGYYPDKVAEHLEQHFGIEDLQPCKSPYCECDVNKCSHPGFYDARGES